ncbi:hypothetical protein BHE74_00009120 [Ensete ventricosum]|nr:hypothetical protein GW17_00032693 [Ensete ventricosum]RWW82403.1 hypothetical protein BHE74_00009120 [Ensete ventricosum]RZR89375.1 hypothetical protein BHM03_00017078 [Ensete ventricosum]
MSGYSESTGSGVRSSEGEAKVLSVVGLVAFIKREVFLRKTSHLCSGRGPPFREMGAGAWLLAPCMTCRLLAVLRHGPCDATPLDSICHLMSVIRKRKALVGTPVRTPHQPTRGARAAAAAAPCLVWERLPPPPTTKRTQRCTPMTSLPQVKAVGYFGGRSPRRHSFLRFRLIFFIPHFLPPPIHHRHDSTHESSSSLPTDANICVPINGPLRSSESRSKRDPKASRRSGGTAYALRESNPTVGSWPRTKADARAALSALSASDRHGPTKVTVEGKLGTEGNRVDSANLSD